MTVASRSLSAMTPDRRERPTFSRLLAAKSPLLMGILNVTPDSFSDGGRFIQPERAVKQAQRLVEEGADILDIGAESTRPYGDAEPVSADEELSRLKPVLPQVLAMGIPVSVDTMKARVAGYALEAGAEIVNDVWGLQRDPEMARVVAEYRSPVVVMHNRERADPAIDIMADIAAFFRRSLGIADQAGIARQNIALDPGIGFGKTPEQSIEVLHRLGELLGLGLPLLVGLSRKRFISSVMVSEPDQRLGGSIAGNVLAVMSGASIVRTHDVFETVQALAVAAAIRKEP